MIKLSDTRVKVSTIDKHLFICDLLEIEGPLLSLYRDSKRSWFYLWCDTNGLDRERWLIFDVSRGDFAAYLAKKRTLRDVLIKSANILCLEAYSRDKDPDEVPEDESHSSRTLRRVSVQSIQQYLPSVNSLFRPEFAPDISLAQQLLPARYEVPIGGDWFISDLDRFSRAYSSLYGFFYCTKPRFVTSVRERLNRALRAPWGGGFSRINLFDGLAKSIPSLHDMKIKEIDYASPGTVKIEALASVGVDIQSCLDAFMTNRVEIDSCVKKVNVALSSAKVRKSDLSATADDSLNLSEELIELFKDNVIRLGSLINSTDQISTLRDSSPNSVVAAKAVLALLTQVTRLAEYETAGMLNMTGRGANAAAYAATDDWLEDDSSVEEPHQAT